MHKLSSLTSAVTLNLVLGVRKFVSLVLSVLLFRNHFTPLHVLGTAIVVCGTVLYASC